MFPRHHRPFYHTNHQMPHTPYVPQRHVFRPPIPCLPYNVHANNDNYDFWCETCDRGFKSSSLLDKHKNEHEKCNIDGCQFVAHPKVITKHIQMQHSSGLFKKIAVLNDPEEIKKWREERKNKYPTKLNINKKTAENIEKIERGEKMALNQQRNRRDLQNKTTTDYRGKRQFPYNKNNSSNDTGEPRIKNQRNKHKRQPKEVPVKEDKYKLKAFSGIQALLGDSDSDEEVQSQNDLEIDDDEDDITSEAEKPTEKTSVCGALTTIVGNYGSSDEEEVDSEISNLKIKIVNSSIAKVPEVQVKVNVEVSDTGKGNICDDDSGPEEVSNVKQDECENNITDRKIYKVPPTKVTAQLKTQKPKQIPRRPKPKPPSTLLRKLLHREVQQERNIILQCVRHIVKNNYFE